jgi:FAD/FMN-containing dehydrogenase
MKGRLTPHSLGTAYVNFMPEDGANCVSTIYDSNYERLTQIKAKYDPANFFRTNQNITPEA